MLRMVIAAALVAGLGPVLSTPPLAANALPVPVRPQSAYASPQSVAQPVVQPAAQPVVQPAAAGSAVRAKETDEQRKLLLLFDSSGSMKEPDAGGSTKMLAAKQAFATLIPKLPENSLVGLRVYGAKVFSPKDKGACSDSQNVLPVAPVDKTTLASEIARFRPYGETPIAYSLSEAAKDLGTTGKRTILLVSDGEETCDPDPCETAKAISGLGIDLKVDVVGLKVTPSARKQLRCIADSGNGTFYEADDTEDLAVSLERLSIRAFRPFKVDGTPVKGAKDAKSAPVLVAGQYVDSAPAERVVKHYRVRRTIPGSTLFIGASARPGPGATLASLTLGTHTVDGWSCGYGVGTEASFARTNPIVTAVSSSIESTKVGDRCSKPKEIDVTIEQAFRTDVPGLVNMEGMPIEIVVVEEPPVTNLEALPPPATDIPAWARMPSATSPKEVVPGASFSDAPTIEPGSFRTSIFPGEVQFYRVHLDWSQRLQVDLEVPKPSSKLTELIDYPQGIDLRLIGPTRGDARSAGGPTAIVGGSTIIDDDRASQARGMTVEVRHRNREGFGRKYFAATLPGDYYLAVALGGDVEGQSYLVPLNFRVGVAGTAGIGAPAYSGGKHLLGPGVSGSLKPPAGAGSVDSAVRQKDPGEGQPQAEAERTSPLQSRLLPASLAALACLVVLLIIFGIRRRKTRPRRGAHA